MTQWLTLLLVKIGWPEVMHARNSDIYMIKWLRETPIEIQRSCFMHNHKSTMISFSLMWSNDLEPFGIWSYDRASYMTIKALQATYYCADQWPNELHLEDQMASIHFEIQRCLGRVFGTDLWPRFNPRCDSMAKNESKVIRVWSMRFSVWFSCIWSWSSGQNSSYEIVLF